MAEIDQLKQYLKSCINVRDILLKVMRDGNQVQICDITRGPHLQILDDIIGEDFAVVRQVDDGFHERRETDPLIHPYGSGVGYKILFTKKD